MGRSGRPGNASNDYRGGHGLSHIKAKHPDDLASLPDTLRNGTAYRHDASRRKLYLADGDRVAVLTKDFKGRTVLTSYSKASEHELERITSHGRYHAKGEN